MFLFPLFGLAVLFSMGYTFYRYQELWRCIKLPIGIYWCLQVILLVNYFLLTFSPGFYANEVLANVMSIIAALYFMYFLYSGFICLLMDLIAKKFCKKNKSKFMQFLRKPKGGLLTILCITLIFGIAGVIGTKVSHFVNYEITIKKETSLEQLKIALISDLHMGTGVTRVGLTNLVNKINGQNVDVVFLVGDYFDHGTSESLKEHTANELLRLKSTYGILVVKGNHERYLSDDSSSYLKKSGIRILEDEIATIADGITIIGRKDMSNQPIPTEELMKNIDKSKPIILLEHQPRDLEESANAGVDLELCGHTHGGQFPLGNIGTGLANDMNYGLKTIDDFHAITTAGVGGWSVPIKLFYTSEIALITMKFKK